MWWPRPLHWGDVYKRQELAQTYPFVTYTPKAIPDEEGVSRVVDWLVARKLIPAPYGYEEMVDTGFIQ